MKRISVVIDVDPSIFVLEYDSNDVIVTVGAHKYEFPIESLWDFAKSAVLNSTDYTSVSIQRCRIEAAVARDVQYAHEARTREEDIPEATFEFVPDTHLHRCTTCNEYYDCSVADCTIPARATCASCTMNEDITYSTRSNP